jgi:hypothetical protein
MYNTDFKVKYHEIKRELLVKKNGQEYTEQDIIDVCSKLYRDELVNVFYAENILDDKIDAGMKQILTTLTENSGLRAVIDSIKEHLMNDLFVKEKYNSEIDGSEIDKNIGIFVLLVLFSEDVFYITHQCICQQLVVGIVDNDLLLELKHSVSTFLSNKQ